MRQKQREAYPKDPGAVPADREAQKESAAAKRISILWSRLKLKSAARSLAKSPEKFEGLYEPIYRLVQNPALPVSALKEWSVRAEYLYPGSELEKLTRLCSNSAWAKKKPQKAGALLMRCAKKAGITREALDETNELLLTPLQASAYRALDGAALYAGQTVRVITAAWYCNELVVEHGMTGEL